MTIAREPTFDAPLAAAAYSLAASRQREADTVLSPGWMSILAGLDDDKHGVANNDDLFEQAIGDPSLLMRATRGGAKPRLATWRGSAGWPSSARARSTNH